MTKMQSKLFVLMLAFAVGLLAYIAWGNDASANGEKASSDLARVTSDPREAVSLNDAQVHFAKGQMRGFLQAIQDLDTAEMQGDLEGMAVLAAAQAPGQKRSHPDGFHDQLPDGFRG